MVRSTWPRSHLVADGVADLDGDANRIVAFTCQVFSLVGIASLKYPHSLDQRGPQARLGSGPRARVEVVQELGQVDGVSHRLVAGIVRM
jgi:hypothetical protein